MQKIDCRFSDGRLGDTGLVRIHDANDNARGAMKILRRKARIFGFSLGAESDIRLRHATFMRIP